MEPGEIGRGLKSKVEKEEEERELYSSMKLTKNNQVNIYRKKKKTPMSFLSPRVLFLLLATRLLISDDI